MHEVYKVQSWKQVGLIFASGVSLFLWNCGLIYAANNTVQSHAYIFNAFSGLFIMLATVVLGRNINKLEVIGGLVALIGGFLTLLDFQA